jgi:hypothetical protein
MVPDSPTIKFWAGQVPVFQPLLRNSLRAALSAEEFSDDVLQRGRVSRTLELITSLLSRFSSLLRGAGRTRPSI